MSVELEIQDGSPWWLSPNIWTVPGNDPQGPPGMPIVGEPCYIWAKVLNIGTDSVQNATVRFYWANPAVGFDRNTANLVGSSSVTIGAGGSQDVLCLVPWMPSFVNNGHECVVAEAFHPILDPLPASPDFNVPTDRHVAQRNLSVIQMGMKMMRFSLSFEIHNTQRLAREFSMSIREGNLAELRPLVKHAERDLHNFGKGKLAELGFVKTVNPCDTDDEKPIPKVERLLLKPKTSIGLTLVGKLEGEAALVHVVQETEGKEVGGLSAVVVRHQDQKKEKE